MKNDPNRCSLIALPPAGTPPTPTDAGVTTETFIFLCDISGAKTPLYSQ